MVSISSYFDSYLQKWCDVSSESEYHSEVGHTVYATHEPTHHHQVDQQGGKDTTERDKEHSDGQTCHSDTQQDVGRNKSEIEKKEMVVMMKVRKEMRVAMQKILILSLNVAVNI